MAYLLRRFLGRIVFGNRCEVEDLFFGGSGWLHKVFSHVCKISGIYQFGSREK